jgi:hypothetical protein
VSVATFPLVGTPTTGFAKSDMVPNRRQAAGLLAGGRDLVVDQGAPSWTWAATTQPLYNAQIGQWKAFRASLRGAGRFFYMWDPWREYPGAYMPTGWGNLTRATGGAFDGSAAVATIGNSGLPDGGRDTIKITTLPAAFALGPGDGVQLHMGSTGKQSRHEVLDNPGVVADSGGNLTVWIEPEVPADFTTAAVVQLHRASAKWRATSISIPLDSAQRVRPATVVITAVSVML